MERGRSQRSGGGWRYSVCWTVGLVDGEWVEQCGGIKGDGGGGDGRRGVQPKEEQMR